jgi:hypothetical protein
MGVHTKSQNIVKKSCSLWDLSQCNICYIRANMIINF